MQIAFRKRAKSFFSSVIRIWTRGKYSHVELVFSDGMYFSSQEGEGVRFKAIPIDPEHWDYLPLAILPAKEAEIRAECEDWVGAKYDWRGIAFSFLPIPIGWQHFDRWFCSEICAAMLQRAGYLIGYAPASLSPNGLHKAIKRELEPK